MSKGGRPTDYREGYIAIVINLALLGLTDKQIQRVFKRMISNRHKAMEWIDQSFLSAELKMAYKKVVHNRYAQLSLVE